MESASLIYNMTISEIELMFNKMDQEIQSLKNEVLEKQIKSNQQEEEILRVKRQLLVEKENNLCFSRAILKLMENCGSNPDDKKVTTESAGFLTPGYYTGNPSPPTPAYKEPVALPSPSYSSNKPVEEYDPQEEYMKHVRAPFNCQYRHLRLQVSPRAEEEVEEYSVDYEVNGNDDSGYGHSD